MQLLSITFLLAVCCCALLPRGVDAFQGRSPSGRVVSNHNLAKEVRNRLKSQVELASSEREFKLRAEESDEAQTMMSEASPTSTGEKNGIYVFGLNLLDPQDLLTIFFSGVIVYTTGDMLLYYLMKFFPF